MPKGSKASFKTNPVYSIGIGYHFNDLFRADLNLQYRPINIKKSTITPLEQANKATSYSAMLNAYLNLSDSQDDVIPYLTAGVGYGKNKLSNYTISSTSGLTTATVVQSGKTTNNLMLNVGAGITIAIVNNLRVDIGYRYYSLGKLKGQSYLSATGANNSTGPYKITSLKANEVTVGLIFKF